MPANHNFRNFLSEVFFKTLFTTSAIGLGWAIAHADDYSASKASPANYAGSSFNEIWKEVTSDIYPGLPYYKTTYATLVRDGVNYMLRAARATLSDSSDLWAEKTQKLIRPNGICLAGSWNITRETGYSGYFAKNSKAFIVARASVGFDETEAGPGKFRAFGLAGKLFPTQDADQRQPTANFFLIDDNAGTELPHFLDAPLVNEPPLTAWNLAVQTFEGWSLKLVRILKTVKDSQAQADIESGIRQLYPIARAGLSSPADAKAPALLNLVASRRMGRVDEKDFRNELRVANYPCGDGVKTLDSHAGAPQGCLRFDIYTAPKRGKTPDWSRAGYVEFNHDAISETCDERLHFSHPRWIAEKN